MRLLLVESLVLSLPGAALGYDVARPGRLLLREQLPADTAPVPDLLRRVAGWHRGRLRVASRVRSAARLRVHAGAAQLEVDLAAIMKDDLSPRGGSRGRLRQRSSWRRWPCRCCCSWAPAWSCAASSAAQTADTGFDSRNVASVSLDVKPSGYDETRGRELYKRLLDTVRLEPGVESAALASQLPLTLVDGTSLTPPRGTPPSQGRTAFSRQQRIR